ncbi:cytochrome P450 [Kitasatospora sp. NPDC098652]|uniref:cytochrome P450 n=1 Tax=Kitasatospora sp. NPDC098652 TaxID=3364095 RepID=UPI00380804A4
MSTGETVRMPLFTDGGAELLEWMRRMRDEQPLWQDERGHYFVFRYDDVQEVFSDPARFSSNIGRLMPVFGEEKLSANLPWQDPPDHRKLRQLVSQAFTPKTVAALRPRIGEIVQELLAAAPDDTFDFVEYLAYPLPVIVIAELLGISPADRAFFRQCADRLLGIRADDSESDQAAAQAIADTTKELDEYLVAEVRRRRSDRSTGDVLGALAAAELDGQRLTDLQVATFAALLLNTGHITTTLLLGNTLLCLGDTPEAEARIRADRSLVPAALEEVVRWRPPFPRALRIATEELELAGGVIPANGIVMPSILSANHDERQFREPERFDIDRDPNRHVGFGHGIHFCLGAPLARLETEIALNGLMDAFTELRATGDAVFHDSEFYGVKKMTVSARRS